MDDSCCTLAFNKVFGVLVNCKACPMFKILDDSMQEDLVPYLEEENYMQIYKAIQAEACKYVKILLLI